MEHVIVYKESGRFAGWPANYGAWAWGDEIVVGFESGHFKVTGPSTHAIDKEKPRDVLLARSRDGGVTWASWRPAALNAGAEGEGSGSSGRDIEFSHPGLALTCRDSPPLVGGFLLHYSYDRCASWAPPVPVRVFPDTAIAPRTDYVVHSCRECSLFLTAMKSDGKEGRPFCLHTGDAGRTWEFRGWIGPEPEGFAIMPSTVMLPGGELVSTVRRQVDQDPEKLWWIETYASRDSGRSWDFVGFAVERRAGLSNPSSLVLLRDGRICITYGSRSEPRGIYARTSADGGRSWSEEVTLRRGGGNWDLGYTRSVQVDNGEVVTIYYYNDDAGEERYIAATIWDPASHEGSGAEDAGP